MNINKKIKIGLYSDFDKRFLNDKFLFSDSDDFYSRIFKDLIRSGFFLHTLDVFKKHKTIPNVCLFFDMPKRNLNKIVNIKKTKSILLIRENLGIRKINFDLKKHKSFDRILTWDKSLVDNKKYFFIPSGTSSNKKSKKIYEYEKKKLCTLINANKFSKANGELYSKRLEIIKWFEKNRPESFDLYGYGWDEFYLILFSKTIFRAKKLFNKRSSYKGTVKDKLSTLKKYKFAICFENNSIDKGNITEKILDCFQAKVVPIYYGAPDIQEYIPESCYIDFRRFKNMESIYEYISCLPKNKYQKYLENIEAFLESKNFYNLFTYEKAKETIILSVRDSISI